MESLKNKVAVITGASAGIGEGTALLFAKHGSHLTLTGRDQERLGAVVEKCVKAGCPADKIVTVIGDLREKAVQQDVLDKTVKTFGRIDILVNNAGMIIKGKTMQTTEESYDQVMNVNMKAVMFLTKLLVPEIIKTKGNIINVSSICGQRAMEGVTTYCLSKAALDMFTQCLALELAPQGVRVNAVNPGTVVSLINLRGPSALSDEEYAKFLEIQSTRHPLGGVAVPEDIANTIAYLASDMSRFVSGNHVFVDGARHCVSVPVATSVPDTSGDKK
ncbi:3-oxoacyl-[acyl-carrier-protein] reductase FabG-like [Babylonia areolata]|uniref:3-oxoacyl-[acyl-carrier-protein] reductase FabG-like n=1 Tax=Babylonia areolata TaxID=304850 RepID=UPI003FCF0D68